VKLRTAHIILICAAIFLGAVLLAFGLHRYFTTDDATGLVLAGAGAGAGVGLAFYLRYFLAKSTTGRTD
jgi:uncharacterized membrane-anchored protein